MFTVDDIPGILAQLTLEEKASLCSGQDFWHTQAIERLDIPALMVADGPHGLRKQAGEADHLGLNESVPATCFPSAAGLGSTWDPELLERMGQALGAEVRANNVGVLLGPGVNMKRSPLCGRNFEYFAEDPLLAGVLAAALARGIQSAGVGTSLKHYAANNQENDRLRVDAQVDERTLREIYLPAFERVVKQAQPETVMCSYNKVNGVHSSENPWLLTEVLRDEWGFEGVVVSDWGAVSDRPAGVAAGLDLEMPASFGINDAKIVAAVRAGELDEADVDRAAGRVLRMVARRFPAASQGGPLDLEGNHVVAREVATRTAVLLKNEGALPLGSLDGVVVIGELARTPRYQGAGSSQVNPYRLESALEALRERRGVVPFAAGYRLAEAAGEERSDAELLAEAVELARGSTAVVFAGLPAADESEGYDRAHIDLPASHLALIEAVGAVAERLIVVLSNGAAVATTGWEGRADAILELWLGGQAGGGAAAALLLGEAAPSGRLAETIPVRLADVPAQLNFPGERGVVRYGEGVFIGYRGLDAAGREVSFPFGHGLTYTTFGYADLDVELSGVTGRTGPDDVVANVSLTVTNTGGRAGAAVPQLYVGRPSSALARPPRELKGFARVELAAGESRRVAFGLTRRDLSHWDVLTHAWEVEPGTVVVEAGASSRDLPLRFEGELEGPPVRTPLSHTSTIREWASNPQAWGSMKDVLGVFGQVLMPEHGQPEESLAVFLWDLPAFKVPVMFPDSLTDAQLDALVGRFGG